MRTSVHHTISLGCRCHTSNTLKILGLKKYSCPFDWIACDVPVMLQLLKSNFDEFLNPEHLCDHSAGYETCCGHKLYGGSLFEHFNPRDEKQLMYYQRCVTRLKSVKELPPDQHVLYIYQALFDELDENLLIELHSEVTRYRGSDNFTLLYIHYIDSNAPKTTFTIATKSQQLSASNIICVKATIRQPTDGVVFKTQEDYEGISHFLNSQFDFSSITNQSTDDISMIEEKAYIQVEGRRLHH